MEYIRMKYELLGLYTITSQISINSIMKLFLICAALLAVVSAKSFSPKKLKDLEYGFCEGE
jgi:hypothetical protein